jgi:hypothetical protein
MRPASAAELERSLLAFCRPPFRDNMIQRISSAGIVFGTSPPHRRSQPIAPPQHGTDPTLLAPSGMITPSATAAPKRRSKLPLVLAGVLVAGGAAAAIVVATSRDKAKPVDTPPAETAPVAMKAEPPPAAPAPTPAPPAAPTKLTIKFAVEPKEAAVAVDGTPVSGGELVVAPDDAEHTLTVTAPGFKPYEEKLHFDDNQKLVVKLDRAAKASPPPRKQPAQQTKHERIESESPYK